ncbi:MAG: hypothetical protein JXR94_14085 [Candidatus Hydrogenedentes bacterium]|nr:hypothetical protein [Candidatus Hydrogenedentota bacterium]
MDLDKRLKDMERKLAQKTAAIESNAQQRLRALSRRIDEAVAKIGRIDVQTPAGVQQIELSVPALRSERVDMSRERSVEAVDSIMEAEFDVHGRLGGSMAAYPTTYCESAREYIEPLVADMPVSDSQREGLIQQIEQAAQQGQLPPILQSLGVHIPGVGCFINGWYMAQGAGVSPRELFDSPKGFAQIVTTASHEKWGHGFITELTASGAEKKSVQLGKHHLADQFDVRTVDTPDHARLSEQWEILFFSSQYVEEGYATWIERYLAECIAQRNPNCAEFLRTAPSFSIDAIHAALSNARGGAECAQAIQALFAPSASISFESVHAAMADLVAAVDAMGDAFLHTVGMPGCYAIGFCIVDAIAQRQGPKCIPFAVAAACNIQYGLAQISNHDLRNYVTTHPNLNVNTRLALMMFLSQGTKDDVQGFMGRVRDELGITPPFG